MKLSITLIILLVLTIEFINESEARSGEDKSRQRRLKGSRREEDDNSKAYDEEAENKSGPHRDKLDEGYDEYGDKEYDGKSGKDEDYDQKSTEGDDTSGQNDDEYYDNVSKDKNSKSKNYDYNYDTTSEGNSYDEYPTSDVIKQPEEIITTTPAANLPEEGRFIDYTDQATLTVGKKVQNAETRERATQKSTAGQRRNEKPRNRRTRTTTKSPTRRSRGKPKNKRTSRRPTTTTRKFKRTTTTRRTRRKATVPNSRKKRKPKVTRNSTARNVKRKATMSSRQRRRRPNRRRKLRA